MTLTETATQEKKRNFLEIIEKKLFPIPLLTTRPVTDVGIFFGLMPVWWFLGIEQIIWPFVFLLSALKVVYIKKGRVIVPTILRIFLLFILFQIISALSIKETYQYFVFIKNIAVFISPILLLFILYNSIHAWEDVKWLMKVILLTMAFSSIFGLLGIIGVWRPNFYSLLAPVLPRFITESDAGNAMVIRSIGDIANFLSLRYFRVNGFFTYPTLFGTALITTIPFAIFFYILKRNKMRGMLWLMITILLIINLFSTTGRGANVSFIAGFLFLQLIILRKNRIPKYITISFAILVIIFVLIVEENILSYIFQILTMRSTGERLSIYSLSFKYLMQRPFFGWGIARMVDEVNYPLGALSYYIAVIFRFGIVGFSLFIWIHYLLWNQTKPLFKQTSFQVNSQLMEMNKFLQSGRWILFALIIDGVGTAPITNMMTMVIIWFVFSLLLVTRRMGEESLKNQGLDAVRQ